MARKQQGNAGQPAAGSRRAQRQEEARRRAERQRQQRRLLYGGIAVVALIVVGVIAWQVTSGGEASAGELYRFNTQDFHSLAFDPGDPNTIYFGHHDGLMVSHDGGHSWENATLSGADAMALAIPASDAGRRYVAGHNVFLVSTDGGQTWNPQPNNLPDLDIHSFAAAPSDPLRLYAFTVGSGLLFTSGDGGASWEALVPPEGVEAARLPVSVAADDPLHLYGAAGSRLAESRDGGKSWQLADGPGGTIVAVAVAPDDASTIFAGTETGLWKRQAGGQWTKLPAADGQAILAIAISPSDPNQLALVDANGGFYRADATGRIVR